MELLNTFKAFILIILLWGCKSPVGNKGETKVTNPMVYTTLKEIPSHVKTYLDTLANGEYNMADTGENWNAGCNLKEGEPSKKFVSARMQKDTFELKYLQGGIATVPRQLMLRIKDGQVLEFKLN